MWCGRLAQVSVSQRHIPEKQKLVGMVLLKSSEMGLDNNCSTYMSLLFFSLRVDNAANESSFKSMLAEVRNAEQDFGVQNK